VRVTEVVKEVLPRGWQLRLKQIRYRQLQRRVKALPPLNKSRFRQILQDDLQVQPGEVLFVHSSVDHLHLDFPFFHMLVLLREAVGVEGTLVFPTYPELDSYKHLLTQPVFDVRKSPSYSGILTEFARRQRGAKRSLHPAKSVCALGPLAEALTATHHHSPYPYDRCSPYYQLVTYQARIIGVGVSTNRLAFVHTVDDALKADFPVQPYHERRFRVKCIDAAGQDHWVETYAHNMHKMNHNVRRYMALHVPDTICQDIERYGMAFFRADAARLFHHMIQNAQKGITIYTV